MTSNNEPVSPVKGAATAPTLTISAAAINTEPVELEASPISPQRIMRRGSLILALNENDLTPAEKERRAQLIAERQRNPAVMVDIPQTPQAEELEKSLATVGVDAVAEKAASTSS